MLRERPARMRRRVYGQFSFSADLIVPEYLVSKSYMAEVPHLGMPVMIMAG
jgi:hypothetical protein